MNNDVIDKERFKRQMELEKMDLKNRGNNREKNNWVEIVRQ